MRSSLIVFILFFLFISSGLSQVKSDKNCCGGEKSTTGLSKTSEVSNDVSLSKLNEDKLYTSNESDKDKKVDKNLKSTDKSIKEIKIKHNSSDAGCCSSDKKKSNETKSPKS